MEMFRRGDNEVPTTVLNPTSMAIGLGSCGVGLLALLLSWVPGAGTLIVVPAGAIGVLLAGIGFGIAAVYNGRGVQWPMIGLALSGVAIALGMSVGDPVQVTDEPTEEELAYCTQLTVQSPLAERVPGTANAAVSFDVRNGGDKEIARVRFKISFLDPEDKVVARRFLSSELAHDPTGQIDQGPFVGGTVRRWRKRLAHDLPETWTSDRIRVDVIECRFHG